MHTTGYQLLRQNQEKELAQWLQDLITEAGSREIALSSSFESSNRARAWLGAKTEM